MRWFLLATALILLGPVARAQLLRPDTAETNKSGRLSYGVNLGSEFAATRGFGSALHSWVTPSVSYRVTPKLLVGGGISILQSNYFNLPQGFVAETGSARVSGASLTGVTLFAEGSYAATDRLTLYGSAFKQFPVAGDPLPYSPFTPLAGSQAQGFRFNVNYRIGNNMFIEAGFRYTDGQDPRFSDPFRTDPFRSGTYGNWPGAGFPGW